MTTSPPRLPPVDPAVKRCLDRLVENETNQTLDSESQARLLDALARRPSQIDALNANLISVPDPRTRAIARRILAGATLLRPVDDVATTPEPDSLDMLIEMAAARRDDGPTELRDILPKVFAEIADTPERRDQFARSLMGEPITFPPRLRIE